MTSFMRSLDKLKPLYFLCRSAYGHQTWQDGNLSWWAPTHKVTKTINTWSCKVSWQSKTIISPLPQLLWLPNLADWWFTLRSSYQFIDMTFYSRGLVKSHDKLKTLYFRYHNIYYQQIWQGVDKPWGALIQKVTWSFNHVVLWGHGTN